MVLSFLNHTGLKGRDDVSFCNASARHSLKQQDYRQRVNAPYSSSGFCCLVTAACVRTMCTGSLRKIEWSAINGIIT